MQKKDSSQTIVKFILLLAIGAMFVAGAILKIISIDQFELYVFSFDLFGFTLTSLLVRLLITFELCLGLGLILRSYYTILWKVTLATMVLFTLFLSYAALFRDDTNCHCFGELFTLTPLQSIIKNVVVIFLLFALKKMKEFPFSRKKILSIPIIIFALVPPFVLQPMDVIYNRIVPTEERINIPLFYDALEEETINTRLAVSNVTDDSVTLVSDTLIWSGTADREIVAIVTAGCKFCRIGLEKLMLILTQNNIDNQKVTLLIWGDDQDIITFLRETGTTDCNIWRVDPMIAINITFGRFPTFVMLEQKHILWSANFRELDEKTIVDALKSSSSKK